MGKEVATRSGGYLATNEDFYAKFAQEVGGMKGGGRGKAFLKFDGNSGEYSYGADDEELPLGSKIVMNPMSYARGWVIWVDGEVVHEEMVLMTEGDAPTKGRLPDKGPYGDDDGPVEQYTIDFALSEEPFTEMVFQANNASKRRALAALFKDFLGGYKSHPQGSLPIVKIDENEFQVKAKGKSRKITKHAPSFKIVDWMSPEEAAALLQGKPDDYEDEDAPKKGARRLAAPKDDQDEDDRPARRSRKDEDDDKPARRTRKDEADEEDEKPARRSRKDEADEEDEDRPARRSRKDVEEDEDKPARRSRKDEDEEDEKPARRARKDEDEEDEKPARRARKDEDEEDEKPARRARKDEDEEDEERPAQRRGRF